MEIFRNKPSETLGNVTPKKSMVFQGYLVVEMVSVLVGKKQRWLEQPTNQLSTHDPWYERYIYLRTFTSCLWSI